MPPQLMFFYGTLKRGGRSNHLLSGQEFLSEVVTHPLYRLFNCGNYPGLALDLKAGASISGELWRVSNDALVDLDQFEVVPDLFDRKPVAVNGYSGSTIHAYFYMRATAQLADAGICWPAALQGACK